MPARKEKKGKTGKKTAITQKAVAVAAKKIEKAVEKPTLKNVAKSVKSATQAFAHAGVDWLWESGWETVVSLSAATILSDPSVRNQVVYRSADPQLATITAGTILYKFPVSASMFSDINDRLQKQLSLYTKYQFVDSSIHFKGAAGELVSGQIGIFVVPDPGLVVTSTDATSVVRLVRQYSGTVVKLTKTAIVSIPNIKTPLFVQPDANAEVRFENQGVVYIVAITDLDSTVPIGEFAIKFKIGMIEPANTGLMPRNDPAYGVSIYPLASFVIPSNASYVDYCVPTSSTKLWGQSGSYFSGGKLFLYPGAYRVSTNARMTMNGATGTVVLTFVWYYTLQDAGTNALLQTSTSQNMYNYTTLGNIIYSHNLNWVVVVDRLATISLWVNNTNNTNSMTVGPVSVQVDTVSSYNISKIASSALLSTGMSLEMQTDVGFPGVQVEAGGSSKGVKKVASNQEVGYLQAMRELSSAISEAEGYELSFPNFEKAESFISNMPNALLREEMQVLALSYRKKLGMVLPLVRRGSLV